MTIEIKQRTNAPSDLTACCDACNKRHEGPRGAPIAALLIDLARGGWWVTQEGERVQHFCESCGNSLTGSISPLGTRDPVQSPVVRVADRINPDGSLVRGTIDPTGLLSKIVTRPQASPIPRSLEGFEGLGEAEAMERVKQAAKPRLELSDSQRARMRERLEAGRAAFRAACGGDPNVSD